MPKSLSPDDVLAILASGNLENLLGVVEDEGIEAKSKPYDLTNPRDKFELAKDVTGFANAKGGVIVIGARTERSPVHLGDEIVEVRPFQETLVNRAQYLDLLRAWVYPELERVEVRWFRSVRDPDRGIVSISIPTQPDIARPFLTAHFVDEGGRQRDIIFGYSERRRAQTDPMRVSDLYVLIRDGRRFDAVQQRFDAIDGELVRLREMQPTTVPSAVPLAVLQERKDRAVAEASIGNVPHFVLAAAPRRRVEVRGLFQDRSPLAQAIADPPRIRRTGFGISGGRGARIVEARLRRAVRRGDSIFEVWRDGAVIHAAEASGNLCWGSRDRHALLRINPLQLCETVYAFAYLVRLVSEAAEAHEVAIDLSFALRNMQVDGLRAELKEGSLNRRGFDFDFERHAAPGSEADLGVVWKRNMFEDGPDGGVGKASYRLIAEIYGWFGIAEEKIPYSSTPEGGEPRIDPDIIRATQS